MKLAFAGALLGVALLFAPSARAQGVGVHVGPKAGVSLAVLDGQLNGKSFYKTGFSGGLMMRCRSSERFAIQPELLFVQQGAGTGLTPGSNSPDYDLHLNYFQVPIMMKIYIGSVVNVQFGPQAGLLLSARKEGTIGTGINGPVTGSVDVRDNYYALDLAASGGLGVDLHNGLVASARFNYGFVDINSNRGEADLRKAIGVGGLHNRGFEFSLGYLIGASKNRD